jgi:UPF0755 protein
MKKGKRFPKGGFFSLLVLMVVGASGWQGWAWWTWAIAAPVQSSAAQTQKPVKVQIPLGTSAQEIGENLESLGMIRSADAWNLWSRWLMLKDPQGGFQAGIYQISPAEPLPAIAARLWQGDVVHLSFTIPEGWSLQQMAVYFETQGLFSSKSFMDAATRFPLAEYPWIPKTPAGFPQLEGYLYPDTYQLAPGESVQPEQIIRQMLDRFAQVALPLYPQEGQKTSLSFSQWVTLASIVEKEAVVARERPLIAGVFLNRLKNGMPLGADPTVEYGLNIRQTPDKTLTLEEVSTPSPYNTYLNPGLPPTPIASPGLASLKAILQPERTNYLYFVARYDGTHVFTRTLTEHQVAQDAIHQEREKGTKNIKGRD